VHRVVPRARCGAMHELYNESFRNWEQGNSICCNVPYSQDGDDDSDDDSFDADEKIKFVIQCLWDDNVPCTSIECLYRYIGGTEASSLGGALLETMNTNRIVSFCITIVNLFDDEDCRSLLTWIETSSSLKVLWLDAHEQYRDPVEAETIDAFFLAVRKSSSIQRFSIKGDILISTSALIDFLSHTRTVVDLTLEGITYNSLSDAPRVADAFRNNRTLLRLQFNFGLEDAVPYVLPIVRALSRNTTLQTLEVFVVWYSLSRLIFLDVQQSVESMLASSQTLKHFGLLVFAMDGFCGANRRQKDANLRKKELLSSLQSNFTVIE
jgi:hypothetical protein